MQARYRFCCVEAPAEPLTEMIDNAREITLRTFRKHVDRASFLDLQRQLGYSTGSQKGLHISRDYHVRFYVSKYKGQPCYYINWSAIEHVFMAERGWNIINNKP